MTPRSRALVLTLFLTLVALGVTVVEAVPRLSRESDTFGDGTTPDDVLVIEFGVLPGETRTRAAPVATPAAARSTDPRDLYTVKPGDTLSSIASSQLGDTSFAPHLAQLNALSDPDQLDAGQVLRLR